MINDKKKKIKVIISSVLLGFIIGFLIGMLIGSNKKKPTIYASADVYTNQMYIYRVDYDSIGQWVSDDSKYIELSPNNNLKCGYVIYNDELEYPIIIYSRVVRFEILRDYHLYAYFMDDNELNMQFPMDTNTFYIFTDSRLNNFSTSFRLSTNTGLGMAEFTENILVNVDYNDLEINGFHFIHLLTENIYQSGFDAGKQEGLAEGYENALVNNPLRSPFSFVYYFMNYEILPNFKMYYLFLIGIGAVLFRTIIKAGLI